jgi:hypothetical protein
MAAGLPLRPSLELASANRRTKSRVTSHFNKHPIQQLTFILEQDYISAEEW